MIFLRWKINQHKFMMWKLDWLCDIVSIINRNPACLSVTFVQSTFGHSCSLVFFYIFYMTVHLLAVSFHILFSVSMPALIKWHDSTLGGPFWPSCWDCYVLDIYSLTLVEILLCGVWIYVPYIIFCSKWINWKGAKHYNYNFCSMKERHKVHLV